jgi:large subunit ribosomal protein L25
MKALKIVAEPRDARGSGPAGRLRHQGLIPAVVYGDGKPGRMIQLNAHDFERSLHGHAGEHMLMDLEVTGEAPLKVLLKEVQHHPVSGKITHADFNVVSMTRKLRVELPIKLVGEPAGVSQQGGVLEHIMRTVEVECLPTDIVEHVDLDVSGLHIGESLLISHIRLDPAKFTILSLAEQAVAAVSAPKIEEEPVAAEAAVAEGALAEPEVITEKKVEGEEGEEEGEEGKGKKEARGEKKEAGKPEAGKKEAAAKPVAGKKEAAAKPEAKPEGKKAK